MIKKILIAIFVIIAILAGLVLLAATQGKNISEQLGKAQNPLYHSLPAGSACVPGRGDCQIGLACDDKTKTCAKP